MPYKEPYWSKGPQFDEILLLGISYLAVHARGIPHTITSKLMNQFGKNYTSLELATILIPDIDGNYETVIEEALKGTTK